MSFGVKLLGVGKLEGDGACAEEVRSHDRLGADRETQVFVKVYFYLDMSGVVIFIADFAYQTHLEAVKMHGSRLGETFDVGKCRVVVIGGFEQIDTFEVFDADVENHCGQDDAETYYKFF